jgi:hypothetical protein
MSKIKYCWINNSFFYCRDHNAEIISLVLLSNKFEVLTLLSMIRRTLIDIDNML